MQQRNVLTLGTYLLLESNARRFKEVVVETGIWRSGGAWMVDFEMSIIIYPIFYSTHSKQVLLQYCYIQFRKHGKISPHIQDYYVFPNS